MFLDYQLPPERIAQRPVEPRDSARLLVARRANGAMEHRRVSDLPELLSSGDLLVVNDSRVLPARLIGQRANTGGKWEGLYLTSEPNGHWRMLCQTRGTLCPGELINIEPGPLQLTLIDRPHERPWTFRPEMPGSAVELLEKFGQVPLPPYIRKGKGDEADRGRYQTVYAMQPGSVAAPTAGLHFTPELLAALSERGIKRAQVTLHVGLGTFQPMIGDDPTQHVMHSEWCSLTEPNADAIRRTKSRGGRIVAVGTTSARTLESIAARGEITAWTGETQLFIYPPYDFRAVDVLMTNFHLPRTSLLLLVDAFARDDLAQRAYESAIAKGYRFFSYGDAMMVI